MFSGQTVAALVIGAILAFGIPIAAVIVFKVKNREVWLPSALIGAGTFIAFALILEQILHAIMLPVVQNSVLLYTVYGALAAGVFEETGRFVAYKTLMKNHLSVKNGVMMGIGHGGIEAIIIVGLTFFSYAALTIMVNSQGLEPVIELLTAGSPDAVEPTRTQLEALTQMGFGNVAISLYERLLAMTFHVCLSVIVFHSVAKKGKLWLYPLAVLLHAAMDVPAALYQTGALPSVMFVEILMTVFTAFTVGLAVLITKKLRSCDDIY